MSASAVLAFSYSGPRWLRPDFRKFHEVGVQSALDLRNIVFGSFDRRHKELD